MHPFDYLAPASLGEALTALVTTPEPAPQASARPLAGGTDLIPLLKDGLLWPNALVDLKPAGAPRGLTFAADGSLVIGALTTLAEIERSAELAVRLPILPQAVREAATPQLRARATVAGNLLQRPRCWYFRGPTPCWLKGGTTCYARDGENKYAAIFQQGPCVAAHPSDLAPALLALDATLDITGPQGERSLLLADLFAPPTADRRIEHQLTPADLITGIHIPAQPEGASGAYVKVMDRQAWAFALVSAAAQVTVRAGRVEQARLVLGGVANVPWRAEAAEALLVGQALTPALAAEVAAQALAGATPLAHNAYKVPMAQAAVRRALLAAAGISTGA